MLRKIAKYIAITLLGVGASIGRASATVYDWNLSGGGVTGSGVLVTGVADNGGFDILSFTGSVDGSSVALYGGQPGPIGAESPGNLVYFDNILYPALDSGSPNCAGGHTLVDGCGIAFTMADGYGNIFDNYSGMGTGAYVFSFADSTATTTDLNATFTIAATPEPDSVLLLATGLAVIGLTRLRRPGVLLQG